jgi:hypothetical protein
MKTTVAQLIAKLQMMPQGAFVEVLGEDRCFGYDAGTYGPVDIEHIEVTDFSDEKWSKSPLFGKTIIHLDREE